MTRIGLSDDCLRKMREQPEGTWFTTHKSGDGYVAHHPDHPPRWIRNDGITMPCKLTDVSIGVVTDDTPSRDTAERPNRVVKRTMRQTISGADPKETDVRA